jgi:hypothetical protein
LRTLTGQLWHEGCSRTLSDAPRHWSHTMGDVLYLGYVVGFFLLTWAFVKLCERV